MHIQCKRCVLDNREVPDIAFDAEGVCNFCLTWDVKEKERKVEATNLPWRLDEIRKSGLGRKYDVILGMSGGVDSSYALHLLISHGLRPLCWSVDTGQNNPIADENIMKAVEHYKVPFIRKVIDLDRFRDLQAALLRSGVRNIEVGYDHVLWALNYETAEEYGCKYIVDGGNMSTEGVMPDAYGYSAKDLTHLKAIFRKFAGKNLTGLPVMSLPRYLWRRFIKKIRVFQILNYFEYRRKAAIGILEKEYGYVSPGEKHIDNIFTWWHMNFYLPQKFGLDKRRPHLSSLVLSKQLTRHEAMQELLKPLEYPELGIEKLVLTKYPKASFEDFPNSARAWRFLQSTYALLKGSKRF